MVASIIYYFKHGKLACHGVERDTENVKMLRFYFSRKVTDAELGYLKDVMQSAASIVL